MRLNFWKNKGYSEGFATIEVILLLMVLAVLSSSIKPVLDMIKRYRIHYATQDVLLFISEFNSTNHRKAEEVGRGIFKVSVISNNQIKLEAVNKEDAGVQKAIQNIQQQHAEVQS